MKIFNSFGITPTNTHLSAGSDYYIPNITNDTQAEAALEAFKKSYNITDETLNDLLVLFKMEVEIEQNKYNLINIVHLYLAVGNPRLDELKETSLIESVLYFINEFLVYDDSKHVFGVELHTNDTLFVNSGIKIALETVQKFEDNNIGIAGLYVNKSGMGNKGYDIRACLVDQDYSGYVHLSVSYTKELHKSGKNIVYCGDKLTQMMLIPIFHTEYEEISEDEYNELMSNSERGSDGFGSSDVKH